MDIRTFVWLSSVIVSVAIAGTFDYDDEIKQSEQYCKMVQLYQDSNGEYGWPDFNNTFEENCK